MSCRRKPIVDFQPITRSIEVPAFTVAESIEMILGIAGKTSAAAGEVEAADQLSTKLGGVALAVDIIANYIRISRRFRSVAEYVPYFE